MAMRSWKYLKGRDLRGPVARNLKESEVERNLPSILPQAYQGYLETMLLQHLKVDYKENSIDL